MRKTKADKRAERKAEQKRLLAQLAEFDDLLDDDDDDDEDEGGGLSLDTMRAALAEAIETVQTESRAEAIAAVTEFAKKIEGSRSRRAPVPKSEESKRAERKAHEPGVRVMRDARDTLYRRMENGLSGDDLLEVRAARNPRMDELTRQWCQAVGRGDITRRVELYEEMNGRYCDELGVSRAQPLLEGAPNADSGFADGTGAELLPLPLSNQLIVERDKKSKMRGLVNVFPMNTQTQRIGVLPTATASTRAENAAYTENTPNPDSALLSAKDLGVEFAAGRNFLEDTAFNMANQLTRVAGGAIGAAEDVQICAGNGVSPNITESFGTATITDLPTAGTTTLAFVDFVALYYAVPEPYRADAAWFMAGTTLVDVMAILDGGATGRPMFMNAVEAPRAINDLDSDAVGVIMGKKVYEVPLADDVVLFGDPMWYALGDRSGIRVDADRNVSTGLRTWVIDERVDGRVIPTSAVGTNNSWRQSSY